MYNFNNVNQKAIYNRWEKLINAENDIKDDTIKMSTALVLENAQNLVNHEYNVNHSRGLITEATAGISVADNGVFGRNGANGYAAVNGDARVPSIVIPMIRRIYPQLLAHKLVGVQPMNGPIGMAFAFRAKYGRFRNGNETLSSSLDTEIGYLNVLNDFTGQKQLSTKFDSSKDQAQQMKLTEDYFSSVSGVVGDPQSNNPLTAFYGANYLGLSRANTGYIGDGADTSSAENWAVGSTMPEVGFEFLKATVTAKTRKLGVQITRETEEDMKAMQGMNAQNEVSDIISYEIAQEIDRQLLGEVVQSAVRVGNYSSWSPAKADGRNQSERIDALYTDILAKSAKIATQSRRGAANWCVASPTAGALLESHIYNPLGVAGGLGNANAFGKSIDNNIGVVEIGSLRNGTIKLYRDTLAQGDYILLGYKGNTIYDAGVIYLPYIPLELMHAVDPFSMNPITAARTRYGITTNLFGAGQFYHFIALEGIAGTLTGTSYFTQQ